jgi:anaerobic selenocysteine-containing dehydrogenase
MVRGAGGRLHPVPWEEAASLVAEKLKALRERGQAHTAVFLAGSFRGLRERLMRRFMAALGSPNYIRAGADAPDQTDPAHVLTQGVDHPIVPNLFAARSILSFGVPLLDGGGSPVFQMRAYGHFRQGEGRPRGVLIQVESRRSSTAERADKWVAIRPGTETTMALGIAHTLILEHLYDEGFVERHCEGFNDASGPDGRVVPGFRTIVLREFTLPRVSQVTGVPVETILSISRAFAHSQPGVAIGSTESPYGPARLGLRLAVHFLNALVGSIGKPGGMLLREALPLGEWDAPVEDALAHRSLAQPRVDGRGEGLYALAQDASETLPERILSGKPYPVNALLVAGIDPLFDHPRAGEFAETISRVPFVVSFSSMPDAISQKAHVVLPDAMYLERWTEDVVTHLAGFSVFSVGRPVHRFKDSPPGLEDTLLAVSQKIGGSVAASFRWKAFSDAILEAALPLAEAGRGYVVSNPVNEQFRTILERQGYWQREFQDQEAFWKALLEHGAWWDSTDEEIGATTQPLRPVGKFQFLPRRLGLLFAALDPKARQLAERALGLKSWDGNYLPAEFLRPPREKNEIDLILYRPLAMLSLVSAEVPWLLEQLGPHVKGQWDSWVEIHPEDARRRGLHKGDLVELRSERGQVRARVRIFEGVQPGAVAMPVGLGRPEGGRWAKGRGVDPRKLAQVDLDPIRGVGFLGSTSVRIRRIA